VKGVGMNKLLSGRLSFSGRKFAVVSIILTYCFTIVGSVILTIMKLMDVPVLIALIAGLSGHVMYIVKAYFDDKDRTVTPTGEKK
jgi:UDP-N-acetylglucosamine enolpyruvyl transferase